ncbi:hypothetical protein [Alphaproteobacteria bacterium endosymbiont of Tiliacea citrago]|uniref:hypothetical protein n=1 Tax=Alphaproteobacteria bacterium endosymbiont of Tiliacea citrago TaxID=3077944 RepID=UPI00313BB7EC
MLVIKLIKKIFFLKCLLFFQTQSVKTNPHEIESSKISEISITESYISSQKNPINQIKEKKESKFINTPQINKNKKILLLSFGIGFFAVAFIIYFFNKSKK